MGLREAADHQSAVYDLTRNVLPSIGATEVSKLTRHRLEAWRAQLAARRRVSTKKIKKERKPEPPKPLTDKERRRRRSTANRTVGRLVAALNYALETGARIPNKSTCPVTRLIGSWVTVLLIRTVASSGDNFPVAPLFLPSVHNDAFHCERFSVPRTDPITF